ncbi:MAG: peptidoglycan D,D-transpeptidase FtsI family protein [Thiomicrospira sp.]
MFRLASHRDHILLALLLLGFVVLAARAFYVQVMLADFLETEGNKRQVRTLDVPAPRGTIVDRHGDILALSTPVASVWVDPKTLSQYPQAIAQLAEVLNVSQTSLNQRVQAHQSRRFLFVQRSILPQLGARIDALGLPGVYVKDEYRRFYPMAESLAQVVGYTNIDDKGQDGIEFIYDGWLAGKAGKRQIIKDLEGRVVSFVKEITPAQPGKSIQLSIDKDIQYFAHRALKETMIKHQAKAASLVILDAKTGEILALVNEPSFNPNNRAQIRGEGIRNRAVASLFEPGSTVKPFALAKALELGLVSEDERIHTAPGYIRIQGHMISDAANYGDMDLSQIIQKSSNVGTLKVANRLAPEQHWQLLKSLGFNQDLGLFLPGESMGYMKHFSEWGVVDQASHSFGYGFNVNLMQLAHAYLVFANQGQLPPLSLLKLEQAPTMTPVLSASAAQKMLTMMESVVDSGGTGTLARIERYRVAGKTGTVHKAQAGGYEADKYVATFVGLVPATRPDMVMAVMVDEPSRGIYGGGAVAAPIFSEVMQHALRLRNIDPDGVFK